MHWVFAALIFHITFQYGSSSNSKLLLKAQNGNQVIQGLATVEDASLDNWLLRVSQSQIVEVTAINAATEDLPDGTKYWHVLKELQFQFKLKNIREMHEQSQQPWIPAIISDNNKVFCNGQIALTIVIPLQTFFKSRNRNDTLYFNYATHQQGVMLLLGFAEYSFFEKSIKETKCLTVETEFSTDNNKDAFRIVLELDNLDRERVPNYSIVFMKYVEGSVQAQPTSMIINNENGELYFSSKCYIKFSYDGVEYIANGGIILFKEVTTRQIWIETVWASGMYTWADNMIEIFKKVHICEIARRKKSNKTPGEFLNNKQWITLNFEKNIRINHMYNRVVTTFNFGTQKRLRYGGNRLTNMPVFVDTSKKQLTLIGTDLTDFEIYRKAVSEAKAKTAKSKQNLSAMQGVKVELFEVTDDPNTRAGMKLFIPDSITANVGIKNPFGFPIFQYNYTL